MEPMEFVKKRVTWSGHASVRIAGDSGMVYIDPYDIGEDPPLADFVFITHSHARHFSVVDLKKIVRTRSLSRGLRGIQIGSAHATVLFGPEDCNPQLDAEFVSMAPGAVHTAGAVTVRAVPAYNVRKPGHPMSKNWLGFVFSLDGLTFYHPGDSDPILAMGSIKADIMFAPIRGGSTMDDQEAAQVVNRIKPKVVAPIQYDVPDRAERLDRFMALSEAKVVLPKKSE